MTGVTTALRRYSHRSATATTLSSFNRLRVSNTSASITRLTSFSSSSSSSSSSPFFSSPSHLTSDQFNRNFSFSTILQKFKDRIPPTLLFRPLFNPLFLSNVDPNDIPPSFKQFIPKPPSSNKDRKNNDDDDDAKENVETASSKETTKGERKENVDDENDGVETESKRSKKTSKSQPDIEDIDDAKKSDKNKPIDLEELLKRELPKLFQRMPNNDQKKKYSKTDSKDNMPKMGPEFPWIQLVLGSVAIAVVLTWYLSPRRSTISFQEFRRDFLEKGIVTRVEVDAADKLVLVFVSDSKHRNADFSSEMSQSDSSAHGPKAYPDERYAAAFNIGSVEAFEKALDQAQHELNVNPHDFVPIHYRAEVDSSFLPFIIGSIAFFLLTRMVMGGGVRNMGSKSGVNSLFSFGKSPATVIKPGDRSSVTFKDVAGLADAKVEVMEFVEFLKNPEKYTRLGAKIPKGALLVGPPGCGKTLLAKAMAGEANVLFYSISGSDFIEMFVGVGPSRVRDLFKEARENAPSIIFIDEIDAVGRSRSKNNFGGNDERENTLNQLLVEMDGFNSSEGVVVLAGTNRKDILDKALLRPGRFDRHITIDLPDLQGRMEIFLVHLKNLKVSMEKHEIAQRLAALTPGYSGAGIANLCNEAALTAARANKDLVDLVDFETAADRIMGGLAKSHSILSAEEKHRVAIHESGHAVCGWFLECAAPLVKVTIVPRTGGSLGWAQYLPKEVSILSQQEITDSICVALGGRAAEQIFFGKVSTGASDDLRRVTEMARDQVVRYGMSEEIGQVTYVKNHEDGDPSSRDGLPFGEKIGNSIDEEVRKIVQACYERTMQMLISKKELVEKLAERLVLLDTINHDVLVDVLGPRQFTNDIYLNWLKASSKVKPQDLKSAAGDANDLGDRKSKDDDDRNSKGPLIPAPDAALPAP